MISYKHGNLGFHLATDFETWCIKYYLNDKLTFGYNLVIENVKQQVSDS